MHRLRPFATLLLLLGAACSWSACAQQQSLGARVAARVAAELDARLAQRLPRPLHRALASATTVEAVSLYPDAEDLFDPELDDDDEIQAYRSLAKRAALTLGGYPAIGTRTLRGARAQQVASLFAWAVAAKKDGAVADCFSPRHALRLEHEGQRFEILICFECEQAQVSIDGESLESSIPISTEPEAAMTRAFLELGLQVEGAP